jgi:hypothetical protein
VSDYCPTLATLPLTIALQVDKVLTEVVQWGQMTYAIRENKVRVLIHSVPMQYQQVILVLQLAHEESCKSTKPLEYQKLKHLLSTPICVQENVFQFSNPNTRHIEVTGAYNGEYDNLNVPQAFKVPRVRMTF